MIRMALENAGIEAQIEGELLQNGIGELPLGWAVAPRILVKESQAAEAREVVAGLPLQARSDAGEDEPDEAVRCLSCGQAMGEADKCSACGWSYQGEQEA